MTNIKPLRDGYYYLSNPYNGTLQQVEQRVAAVTSYCINALKNGISLFSPILHNHTLMLSSPDLSLEERRDIFLRFDFDMLANAEAMIVLQLDG